MKRLIISVGVLVFSLLPAHAQDVTGDQLVDGLNGIFGDHPGRAAHTRGQCVKGSFTPAEGAPAISKAVFLSKPAPVLARFSFGGGNPQVADKSKTPRGLAVRYDPDGGEPVDFVQISVPIFFARSPQQVLEFFKVRAGAGAGKADVEKIKAFTAANPETARQDAAINTGLIPASYAQLTYYGIHAFNATNAEGKQTKIKFKTVPHAGTAGLTQQEADIKNDNFIDADLKDRLANGPISFDLVALIGEEGDPTNDPTQDWPAGRMEVKLGVLQITQLEDNATCDAGNFDPMNLGAGLAAFPDDSVLPMRSQAYAASLVRRSK